MRTLSLVASLLLLSACRGGTDSMPPEVPADTARVSAIPTSALAPDADGPLVLYAGREERIVAPLVELFRERTGVEVEVRYADDASLLASLVEDGDRNPADVFWSSTSGAIASAVSQHLFTVLPDSFRVLPGGYVPASGEWVPVSLRFRVLAYAPSRADSSALPTTVLRLPEPDALKGRIGWTPATGSLQDIVTWMRLVGGDDPTRDWLDAMQDAEARAYPSDTAMLAALASGEIDVALTHHDDVLRAQASGADVAYHFFTPSDPGNLALATGVGVLDTSARQRAARRFVSFLLSPEAQTLLSQSTSEMAVTAGAPAPEGFLPLAAAVRLAPTADLDRLHDREGTLALLRAEGLVGEE